MTDPLHRLRTPLPVSGLAPRRYLFSSFSGYAWADLRPDILAGLTLAAIAIPEQMATARLGGFAPEIGFFAFIAGAIGFAIFGASRFLSAGADSTITPIFAGGLALLAAKGSQNYSELAAALAMMVGIILICGGIFRLGWIANLLSVPVTTGFLAGIGIHIVAAQLPDLLGITLPASNLPMRLLLITQNLGDTHLPTLALGLGVFIFSFGIERLDSRIPAPLIALAAAAGTVAAFSLEDRGVAVLGHLPQGLPGFKLPSLDMDALARAAPLAFIVAVVAMVQSAATTRSFPSDPNASPAVNRDFIGVGAANLLAGFFGAVPLNASPPRTAMVAETGGRSQAAALIATSLVLALASFGGALLAHVPESALAGILLFIATRLIRLAEMQAIWRETTAEFGLVVATMILIVVLPIETGVTVGIVLSLLHGVWTVTRTRVIAFEQVPGTSVWWPQRTAQSGRSMPGIAVLGFQAPLSFLNAYGFRSDMLAAIDREADPLHLVILEASSIVEIDYTAAKLLTEVVRHCIAKNVIFAVARLESVRAQEALVRFGLIDLIGADHIFRSVDEALRTLDKTSRGLAGDQLP